MQVIAAPSLTYGQEALELQLDMQRDGLTASLPELASALACYGLSGSGRCPSAPQQTI